MFNQFGGYGYRSAETILEAVKPLLKETICTIIVSDDILMVGDRFYVKATATIKNEKGEVESATSFAREALTKKGQDESQITGAASSYARKYALCGLLAIDDRRDADTQNNGGTAPKTEDQLKSEFETAKKKLNACKKKGDVIKVNDQFEDLWSYQPFIQLRDQKWNSLPQ